MVIVRKPSRLNLAIGRRCYVTCPGCFSFIGKKDPDLMAFVKSVRQFLEMGIYEITISGGDPLTIKGLIKFITTLKESGTQSIKIDIGAAILTTASSSDISCDTISNEFSPIQLLNVVDFLGVPLDGWSNYSVGLFRKGMAASYDNTIELLTAIDNFGGPPKVIINTVAHKANLDGLHRILEIIMVHSCICQWNIFQYTPTDQVSTETNALYAISEKEFEDSQRKLTMIAEHTNNSIIHRPSICFRSSTSRLGEYLLVNSDGQVWFPDELGNTVCLGKLFDNEQIILDRWTRETSKMIQSKQNRAMSSLVNIFQPATNAGIF